MSAMSLGLPEQLLAVLACPCDAHAPLRVDERAGRLVCTDCGRGYEVVDGIPVLLIDHATVPEC